MHHGFDTAEQGSRRGGTLLQRERSAPEGKPGCCAPSQQAGSARDNHHI
jgi:hypothetical protein